MDRPEPPTPEGSAGLSGMSPAEKLACEWEARHDVTVRGRRLFLAPVQQYLTHSRCEDLQRRAGSSAIGHPPAAQSDAIDQNDATWVRTRLRLAEDMLGYFPLAKSRGRRRSG